MTRDELNNARPVDAARWFLDKGFRIVPIPRKGDHKAPRDKKWPTKSYALADFTDDHLNIGVLNGVEIDKGAFLIDVDIDLKREDGTTAFPGAAAVVDYILPQCGMIFGRDSARRTHLVFLATAPILSRKYEGLNHASMIELRGVSKQKTDKDTGGKTATHSHTVFAPGLHKSGERITFDVWDWEVFVSVKPADRLAELVQHAAVGLAILHVWPGTGSRHDARLAFSKVLLDAGLDPASAKTILKAVVLATHGDGDDVDTTVDATASKDRNETIGASWINEHLERGAETLKIINKILGVRRVQLAEGMFDVGSMDLKTLTPDVWARVRETNTPPRLFLQGGRPVRAEHVPENPRLMKRPSWALKPLGRDELRHEVAQVATFAQMRGFNQVQVVPPGDLINDMLAMPPHHVPLPVVTRIIYAPTMAPDGTIQTTPGYQDATSTYYVEGAFTVPPVAEQPTAEDVAKAVATIREPLQDFSFRSEADLTAAVALMVLPFVRSLIDGPTPLHLVRKPVAGAGATLLIDVLLYPSVGTNVARMSTVDDDDEWRKQITATLLEGPSSIVIDNVRSLTSPQLAKVLTDHIWQGRILGVSRNAVVPVECAWAATGINPTLHQEIARRIVPCQLDPGVERPWLRDGFTIPDLRTWVRDHQADLIHAVLTLARAWHVAGRPKAPRALGMFESWSHVVGGILQHAGFTGFLDNLEQSYDELDLEGDAVRWFFEEWKNQHFDKPMRISDLRLWALAEGSPMCEAMASDKAGVSVEFSKWVRRLKDRVVNIDGQNLVIASVKKDGKSQSHTWKLATRDGSPLTPGPVPSAEGRSRADLPF